MVVKEIVDLLKGGTQQLVGYIIFSLLGIIVFQFDSFRDMKVSEPSLILILLCLGAFSMLISVLGINYLNNLVANKKEKKEKENQISYLHNLTKKEKSILGEFIWNKSKWLPLHNANGSVKKLESMQLIRQISEHPFEESKYAFIIEDWVYEYLNANKELYWVSASEIFK
ncbi:super-infection exclusion protein B [Bacillus sp. PS93]|uniref:super-infection exclusion protein B n=1 Tax=unclassified Bacillus (in: firmicutes) TaxID=185979 RepID=UPI0030D45667